MESSKPKKQRKKFFSEKLHQLHRHLGANLSKELRKVLKKRSLSVRKDDLVKIVRGKHRGKKGKILGLNYKKHVVSVEKITRKKTDGTEVFIPIHASNLLLLELAGDDKKRKVGLAVKIKKPVEKEEKKQVVKEKEKTGKEAVVKEKKEKEVLVAKSR